MDENTKVTATFLKNRFLDAAYPLVDDYVNAALGEASIKSTNAGCREEVWSLLKELMLKSSDKIDIEIGSMRDILAAVESGKCTLEEGNKLIVMYKQVREAEHIGVDAGDKERELPSLNFSLYRDKNEERDQREEQGSERRARSREMVEREIQSRKRTGEKS